MTSTTGSGTSGRLRRALRSLTAYAGVAAVGGALAVAGAPAATADEVLQLSGGSAAWGVKESFRNYVSGPIAGGGFEASDGATATGDGLIDFPTAGGAVSKEDASGDVSFSGTVVFTGHDYGRGPVLEVRVSDPRVVFADGTATVYADVTSREFLGANPNNPPGDLTGYGEVPVADLTGVEVDAEGEDLVFTSAAGTLREEAVEAFAGFYPAGTPMDPLSFTAGIDDAGGNPGPVHDPAVTVTPASGLDPEGDVVTVAGTGFRPGAGVYVALTAIPQAADSYPAHWYGSGVWLRGDTAPDAQGSFSTPLDVVGAFSKGGGEYDCLETQCYVAVFNDRNDLANRDQDVWTPVSFAGGGEPTEEPTEPTEEPTEGPTDPEGPLTVHNGRADWGVRESFRTYIVGNIAKGTIETRDGASRNEDGTFAFTDGSGEVDLEASTAEIGFEGTVLFQGHVYGDDDPLLHMTVRDPRVVIDGGEGTLYADIVSKSLDDAELVTYDDVAFADLDLSGVQYDLTDGVLAWEPIPATLTAEGVPAFADFYGEGERLDPITLTVSVDEDVDVPGGGDGGGGGGGGNPGGGDGGGNGGLPNTGVALAGLIAAAAVAVGAGGVAVAASRRRPAGADGDGADEDGGSGA
ncbi:HtaA domain-containing protein [Nocardiopsis sp. NPDC057823]|uniref:HtaA domain-containing protein n=1 Tax=Nocardiopsis sp. NPDC057823 TaxID=3346256 RepID=UPI00366A7B5E